MVAVACLLDGAPAVAVAADGCLSRTRHYKTHCKQANNQEVRLASHQFIRIVTTVCEVRKITNNENETFLRITKIYELRKTSDLRNSFVISPISFRYTILISFRFDF